jgi:hypothetical protein
MREQLFDTLRALADVDYQRKVWIQRQYPPGVQYDDFDLAVHFLFDDTALFDAPEKTVGWILEDEYEVRAIQKVTKAIDDLLNELGTDLTDEQYINSPMWSDVVKAASEALSALNKNPA